MCDAFLLKRVISSHNSCLVDFEKINRNKILQLNQNSVNLTFDNYLNNRNALHLSQKNLTKNSFNKNHGSQEVSKNQFIKKKNIFKKYITCNNHNNLSTIIKQSKKTLLYCSNYSKNNIKDMKKTHEKGIKAINSL